MSGRMKQLVVYVKELGIVRYDFNLHFSKFIYISCSWEQLGYLLDMMFSCKKLARTCSHVYPCPSFTPFAFGTCPTIKSRHHEVTPLNLFNTRFNDSNSFM